MKTFFTIFSHELTTEQMVDAQQTFFVDRFVSLPVDLQKLWSNVPPNIDDIDTYIQPIKAWLEEQAQPDDIVLISGDFGSTCRLALWSKSKAFLPVYATTTRIAQETHKNGAIVKQSIFKHVKFRELL